MTDLTNTEDTFAEEAILELLRADGAPPQVATVFGGRFFPVILPEDATTPALVYSQLQDLFIDTKDKQIPNGHLFEVAIMAGDFLTVKKGVRAVRQALNGKIATLDGVGELYFSYQNELEPEYDPVRELHIIGLQFGAR